MTSTRPAAVATPVVVAGDVDTALGALRAGVEATVGLDTDALGGPEIRRVLAAGERAIRRLQAQQARLAATLTHRRATQASHDRPDDPRARDKATRQVRAELTEGLGITPSQAKRVTRTGRQLESLPVTAAAHADGRLTDRHVHVITEVTAHFAGEQRLAFERQLVQEAAACRDAVVFGRRARALLIERDHDAAMADLDRRKARRSGRVAQTEDGTTLLRLETAGYAGELVHTVVDAFRTPDAAGQHRTAEQRTHDAVCAAFETALRAGAASTQHGVRPHVALIIRGESVRNGDGAARTRWTGRLPYGEVARVLGDCTLTRIVADATDLPVSVSRRVRTVPAALWQLLLDRDDGCIYPGCDAPPGWCDVAHLETPYANDGRLSPDTAGLLCTAGANHHELFDRLGLAVRWIDGRPHVLMPDGTPVADLATGPWERTTDRSATRPAAPAPPPRMPRSPGSPPSPAPPATPSDDPPDAPALFAREDRGVYCAGAPPGGRARRPSTPRRGPPGRVMPTAPATHDVGQ